jgi:hypothetical protein
MFIYPYPQKLTENEGYNANNTVAYITDNSLGDEEYKIEVLTDKINVYASGDLGFFRANSTLKQINSFDKIPCMSIHDWPTVTNRGIMLDISRSKIPKIETLFLLTGGTVNLILPRLPARNIRRLILSFIMHRARKAGIPY